ncbi:MAG: putative synthase protein [Rhodocyclaceae bacterium]|nr:putative synthase protein [Rhodocyclaceae bacterium]
MSDEREKLEQQMEKDARRLEKAERERPTLLAQTAYIGVLGLVFVLPVVAGAYLGRWIDSLFEGYSVRWTLSLLFLGIVIGAFNVYHLIRERE